MVKIMRKLMLKLIKRYQKYSKHQTLRCRFIPTCSEYSRICYERFNFFKATRLTIWRIIRCNPFTKMQIDNPPKKVIKTKNERLKKRKF